MTLTTSHRLSKCSIPSGLLSASFHIQGHRSRLGERAERHHDVFPRSCVSEKPSPTAVPPSRSPSSHGGCSGHDVDAAAAFGRALAAAVDQSVTSNHLSASYHLVDDRRPGFRTQNLRIKRAL